MNKGYKLIYFLFKTGFKHGGLHLSHVMRKPVLPYANNKGADHRGHPRSLISTFVVRCLHSIIFLVSISEMSRLQLASVAEKAGLSLTWSQLRRQVFS